MDDTEKVLDFFQQKVLKQGFPPFIKQTTDKGVSSSKKQYIISKLLPLMLVNRHKF